MNKYEIAIIGQKDMIMGFKAIGITAVNALTSEEALSVLKELKNEKNGERAKYAIIMVTEELAKTFPEDEYKKLSEDMLPSILIIPGVQGSTGLGMKKLGKIVEKAIGSNILK
ncbi:MAG: V-type ATP synthase subunit F [Candidatus Peregrinibacteria bacterium]|nr:V-type ATP synthase subunit F [Candidatus Peregrinibacteria bacterium]MDZ4245291.1 V-type ATP synthase subunit F [Candidatus Gracilibacteria bacterium]